MSLRDLKEEIYLVLHIKGGHGFGFATAPLLITANLAGKIHESFITDPCPQPKFYNAFVWIMDKTKLKSIWSDKTPVRVECFVVHQSRRSRVGYIILNVKDAQIVQEESKIVEKQIRLLGLSKDVSLVKPELIFSLYITDVHIQSPQLVPQFSPPLENRQVRMADGPLKVTLGSGREHFILGISVVSISNLKQLLPSHSDVESDLVTYSYNLLGAEIVSGVSTSHSIQLSLTSSLVCLKTYFSRQPTVVVRLYMGTLLLGETKIDMKDEKTSNNFQSLLLSDEFHLRKSKHQPRTMACQCFITPAHIVSDVSSDSRPYVEFTVSFSCEIPVVKKKSEMFTVPALYSVGAGGDADNRQRIVPLQSPVTMPLVAQPLTSQQTAEGGKETYRAQQPVTVHTIGITVTGLHLNQPLPSKCWLRLSQACANVVPQQQQVPITDSWVPLQWHLTLVLPQHLLEPTLTTQPATLQLGEGDKVIAVALLQPPDTLILHKKVIECTAVLESEGEKAGEVSVTWAVVDEPCQSATLTDTSITPRTQSKSVGVEVLSPRTRELKILSFVEELEDWAEKQRIMIMEGLKEEEAARLAFLQSKWETEVGGQVCEGRQLVDKLHNMRDQLRQQETNMQDRDHKLRVYKEELERVYQNKLQEFKDLSHIMQDEFNHKLMLITSDKVTLEQEVQELREENAEMKRTLREVESRADKDKRKVDSLTHELKVLKEMSSMEQESKNFFKEHCRKAEQEIHRLNCLRQQELDARLHIEKKSLEHLAFQQIIVERNDLRQDQRLLEDVRQQLLQRTNNSDINANSNGGTVCTDGRLFTDERYIRRAT